ncbi:MAG: LacI family DNA-binding transcriptional regulator [Chitinophagaceae bacterium]|nr:LacI family DNA-binding transcriptional regulator [Chitinophagaceae bacterium]
MKFEAVTIKDIAKALGVSTSTVSRAIRDHYAIKPDTRQLVLDYARKINYHPNPIALSLREKRSRTIGIIISEIANNFFSQNINGIESIAHEKGYTVIISQTGESYVREALTAQFLSSRAVDGILVCVATETKDFSHITELHKRGLPVVCFDRVIDELDTHKVVVDNVKGAYDGVIHLADNGYKRIAFICSSESVPVTRDRLKGYKKALAEKNIFFRDEYLIHFPPGDLEYEDLEEKMDRMMKMKNKPDAVFIASDKLTTHFVRYCRLKRIKVPDQIAIAGFSNLDVSDIFNPSLTVIKQPAFELGKVAVQLLINMIESKRPVVKFETKVLDTELIIRESSARKKNKK